MSGVVYRGRMFPSFWDHYDDFFDHGIGAMAWSSDEEGRRILVVIVPDPTNDDPGWMVGHLYMEREQGNWANPGDTSGWDGDLERPTLTPSVWFLDRKGWHGFIRNGDLVTA